MEHQLAPSAVRTPASRLPRAKIFQQQQRLSPPRTPRTGLSLLSNQNENISKAPMNSIAPPAAVVKPAAAPTVEPIEKPPPQPTAYEAPFEWEFLPDTADFLSLLKCIGCGDGGSGLPFRGRLATADAVNRYDNKENVPPSRTMSVSPSPPSSPGDHHWEESPTRRRRRHPAGCGGEVDTDDEDFFDCDSDTLDDDRVAICFDIDRIL